MHTDRLSRTVGADARTASRTRPVGIACALPEELAAIEAHLAGRRRRALGPIQVVAGRLDGIPVLAALSGVGKIDAALAAACLCQVGRVCSLLALGVAGALDEGLHAGDIVVGTRVLQHDFGAATDGGLVPYRAGQMPLPDVAPEAEPPIAASLERAVRAALGEGRHRGGDPAPTGDVALPPIRFGTIATGDVFVAGEAARRAIRDRSGAIAVEMEGAAVARVAGRFGIPVLVVRAISDTAGAASPADFAAFLASSAAAAANVARRLVPVLAAAAGRPSSRRLESAATT